MHCIHWQKESIPLQYPPLVNNFVKGTKNVEKAVSFYENNMLGKHSSLPHFEKLKHFKSSWGGGGNAVQEKSPKVSLDAPNQLCFFFLPNSVTRVYLRISWLCASL